MNKYTETEEKAATIIQRHFRRYLELKRLEDEFIDQLLNEITTEHFEEIITEADDEEFQQFLRESDEKFEAQEEGLKETYENLGINLQDISDKLENTTKELNEIYANANSSNSPSAYDLCEEIDEQIRKMKELIATTSAEICNAVNKQTEKMKETKQVSELADNIGNIVIEEKGIVQDERKKHKKSTK